MPVIVDYIVKWIDPDRDVEGTGKTRIFQNEEAARREIEGLGRSAPNAHSVQLIKSTTTVKRERLI